MAAKDTILWLIVLLDCSASLTPKVFPLRLFMDLRFYLDFSWCVFSTWPNAASMVSLLLIKISACLTGLCFCAICIRPLVTYGE